MATNIFYSYDSDGTGSLPGGGDPDYSSVGGWETDLDVDLGSDSYILSISNITGTFSHADSVEDSGGDDNGNIGGVITDEDGTSKVFVLMSAGESFTTERVYKVGDHSQYFDVDAVGSVGKVSLDCYDSKNHNDNQNIGGASSTSCSTYRQIRSSPNCSTAYAGKEATGANFVLTSGNNYVFYLGDNDFAVKNFAAKIYLDLAQHTTCLRSAGEPSRYINVVVYESENTNASYENRYGFYTPNASTLFMNCLARDCEEAGFYLNSGAGEEHGAVACTAGNNGTTGFLEGGAGPAYVFSCLAQDNTTDFDSGWASDGTATNWNVSEDNTAPGTDSTDGTTISSLDADYLLTASIGLGRHPDNDFSDVYNLCSFLTSADAEVSIEGTSRPASQDAEWDAGASQFLAVLTFASVIDNLTSSSSSSLDILRVLGSSINWQSSSSEVSLLSLVVFTSIIIKTSSTSDIEFYRAIIELFKRLRCV